MKNKAAFKEIPLQSVNRADLDLIATTPRSPRPMSNYMEGSSKLGGRLWIVTTVIFLGVSIALAGYLIYVEEFKTDSDTQAIYLTANETLQKFPFFFRTPEQQRIVEIQYQQNVVNKTKVPAPPKRGYPDTDCSFECVNSSRNARSTRYLKPLHRMVARMSSRYRRSFVPHIVFRRQASVNIFHGCCISSHTFISPPTAQKADGQTVTIVQFGDKFNQYFPSQECAHAPGCTGCTCAQETAFFLAVVKDKDGAVGIDYVQLPGCCKCFNKFS